MAAVAELNGALAPRGGGTLVSCARNDVVASSQAQHVVLASSNNQLHLQTPGAFRQLAHRIAVQEQLAGKDLKKVIVVPGRLVNLAVK